jgi:hypothetical protein
MVSPESAGLPPRMIDVLTIDDVGFSRPRRMALARGVVAPVGPPASAGGRSASAAARIAAGRRERGGRLMRRTGDVAERRARCGADPSLAAWA